MGYCNSCTLWVWKRTPRAFESSLGCAMSPPPVSTVECKRVREDVTELRCVFASMT